MPKNDFTRKILDFENLYNFKTLQKLPKNEGDLAKLIAAKGFKKLPKVRKIAKSGHTAAATQMQMCTYSLSPHLMHPNLTACVLRQKQFCIFR